MTLILNLSPEAERQLLERAAREGQAAEAIASSLLSEALEWEMQDSEEAVAGIQRGMDDFAAGRFRAFSEFAEEQRRKYNLPPAR